MSRKIAIFLDDRRPVPNDSWTLADSFQKFVDWVGYCLENEIEIVAISFDHDIHDEHYTIPFERWQDSPEIEGLAETGYDAAKWFLNLVEKLKLPFPQIFTHSANTAGALNIAFLCNNFARAKGYPPNAERTTTDNLSGKFYTR